MSRTSAAKVLGILGNNYDTANSPDLSRFIDSASAMVDYVASKDVHSVMTAVNLEVVERWLSAHFYAHSDQLFQSKNTGASGATFQGQTAMCFQSTQYGQTAMLLDLTNTLAKRNQEALTGYKRQATLTSLAYDTGAIDASTNDAYTPSDDLSP